jgi:ABC-2 type transport system permease protein
MSLAHNARVAGMVLRRELQRHVRSPTRVLGALVQPVLFVFVLGYGLGAAVGDVGGVDFAKFVLPGALALAVATSALFAAATTVRDRESGALRGMLVAPVWRVTFVVGKVAGGTGVALLQGAIVLALSPLVGLRLSGATILAALAVSALAGATMAALGTWVAAAVRRIEGFQGMVQFVLFPMVFLSGALFPLDRLPSWLAVLTRLDPLTYAVDPLRRILLSGQGDPADLLAVSLLGGTVGVAQSLLLLGILGVICLVGAVWEITRRG